MTIVVVSVFVQVGGVVYAGQTDLMSKVGSATLATEIWQLASLEHESATIKILLLLLHKTSQEYRGQRHWTQQRKFSLHHPVLQV